VVLLDGVMPVDDMVTVAGGVRLRVRRWPGRARRPFLLVHGLASNARLWDLVAARLAAAGHPGVAVDLRGHGESDVPPDGYDTATAAADLSGLVADGAIVVGQSWGGNVAVALAAGGAPVAGLALVDGGWIDLRADFASWEACLERLTPPPLDGLRVAELRAGLRRAHPDWSAEAVEATLANVRVDADGRVSRRLPLAHHLSILRSMWDDPPWPRYPAVRVPALLLPAVPADPAGAARVRARVARAAAALPRATVLEYVGADHDLHAQHPDKVAADLLTVARES